MGLNNRAIEMALNVMIDSTTLTRFDLNIKQSRSAIAPYQQKNIHKKVRNGSPRSQQCCVCRTSVRIYPCVGCMFIFIEIL